MTYAEDRQAEVLTAIANNTKSICELLERIAAAFEEGNRMAQQARDELVSIARGEEG